MNYLTARWIAGGSLVGFPLRDRLLAKTVEDCRGCWLWGGARTRLGYGTATIGGKARAAHRAIYEIHRGPIPAGFTLDHLCRVRECVNPAHMEPVTLRENILRGTSPSARHAAKTHCVNGHKFTPENTYLSVNKRKCKTCSRARKRKPCTPSD